MNNNSVIFDIDGGSYYDELSRGQHVTKIAKRARSRISWDDELIRVYWKNGTAVYQRNDIKLTTMDSLGYQEQSGAGAWNNGIGTVCKP